MNAEARRIQLRPCPFCAWKKLDDVRSPMGGGLIWKFCTNCGAAGPAEKSLGEAELAWNGFVKKKEERRS